MPHIHTYINRKAEKDTVAENIEASALILLLGAEINAFSEEGVNLCP